MLVWTYFRLLRFRRTIGTDFVLEWRFLNVRFRRGAIQTTQVGQGSTCSFRSQNCCFGTLFNFGVLLHMPFAGTYQKSWNSLAKPRKGVEFAGRSCGVLYYFTRRVMLRLAAFATYFPSAFVTLFSCYGVLILEFAMIGMIWYCDAEKSLTWLNFSDMAIRSCAMLSYRRCFVFTFQKLPCAPVWMIFLQSWWASIWSCCTTLSHRSLNLLNWSGLWCPLFECWNALRYAINYFEKQGIHLSVSSPQASKQPETTRLKQSQWSSLHLMRYPWPSSPQPSPLQ